MRAGSTADGARADCACGCAQCKRYSLVLTLLRHQHGKHDGKHGLRHECRKYSACDRYQQGATQGATHLQHSYFDTTFQHTPVVETRSHLSALDGVVND